MRAPDPEVLKEILDEAREFHPYWTNRLFEVRGVWYRGIGCALLLGDEEDVPQNEVITATRLVGGEEYVIRGDFARGLRG
jgi:hypothetical protein